MNGESIKKAIEKGLEDAELLDFEEQETPWTTLKLSDGSIIKVKPVIAGVVRYKKHDPFGFPVYQVMGRGNIVRLVKVPDQLRKKPSKPGVA